MQASDRVPSTRTAPDKHTPGANGVEPEGLGEIQRLRLLASMVDVCAESGASSATVARVVARSGVSRRTFYEQFADREDCFLAAFDQTVERIAAVVLPAYRQPLKWSDRMRAALAALLEYLDVNRGAARFAIVETFGAGPKALERRGHVLAHVVAAIDEGRLRSKADSGPPPLTAEGMAGAAFSLVHSRLLDEREGSLIELLNPLMSMIVLPYLGSKAARKELERSMPKAREDAPRAVSDPLRDLDMRLTYRTMRVLTVVGAHSRGGPCPSNRQIADASGIRDQGQISKLLSRLEHLGLVENVAEHRTKGEPNKWRLTERGSEVRGAIAGLAT